MVDSKMSAPIEPRYAATSPHLPSSLSYGKYKVSLHLPLNTYGTINRQSLPHGKTRILAFLTRINQTQMLPVAWNTISVLQLFSTIKSFWVEGHADKHGPPFSPQEELKILTDGLATLAQTALPPDTRPRPDCLHFHEQKISIVIRYNKVTSQLPYHVYNAIHGPKLTKYLIDKESWPMPVYNSIAWDSLKIAFNKLTARQSQLKQCSAFGARTFDTNMTVDNSNNATYVEMKTNNGVMSSLVKAMVL
jgi:hypothetical protein